MAIDFQPGVLVVNDIDMTQLPGSSWDESVRKINGLIIPGLLAPVNQRRDGQLQTVMIQIRKREIEYH